MKRDDGFQVDPERTNGNRFYATPASELIRSAERFIATGKLVLAKEQLSTALGLDPNNSYISAILERLDVLETRATADASPVQNFSSLQDQKDTRYLSVTVGSEFRSGVRSSEGEPALSAREIQNRIRRLTSVAESFLESGSYKNAFESLMKAYLLDPLSPFVLACEKAVFPVWERARASEGSHPDLGQNTQQERFDSAAHG
jgi:hypothetical protein